MCNSIQGARKRREFQEVEEEDESPLVSHHANYQHHHQRQQEENIYSIQPLPDDVFDDPLPMVLLWPNANLPRGDVTSTATERYNPNNVKPMMFMDATSPATAAPTTALRYDNGCATTATTASTASASALANELCPGSLADLLGFIPMTTRVQQHSSSSVPNGNHNNYNNDNSNNNQFDPSAAACLATASSSSTLLGTTKTVSPYDSGGGENGDGSAVKTRSQQQQRQKHHRVHVPHYDGGVTAKGHQRQFAKHNYHDHANDDWLEATAATTNTSSTAASHPLDVNTPLSSSSLLPLPSAAATTSTTAFTTTPSQHLLTPMRGGVMAPFPLRLHTTLDAVENEGLTDIVCWQPHGRAFVVHDIPRFVRQIMPRFFRQHKYSSFQRQLNLYGFMRLTKKSPDHGGYYHELFLRDRLHLCASMQRVRVKGTLVRTSSSPETEPDFYSMPFVQRLVQRLGGGGNMSVSNGTTSCSSSAGGDENDGRNDNNMNTVMEVDPNNNNNWNDYNAAGSTTAVYSSNNTDYLAPYDDRMTPIHRFPLSVPSYPTTTTDVIQLLHPSSSSSSYYNYCNNDDETMTTTLQRGNTNSASAASTRSRRLGMHRTPSEEADLARFLDGVDLFSSDVESTAAV